MAFRAYTCVESQRKTPDKLGYVRQPCSFSKFTGIDILIGLDPKEGQGTDLQKVKEKFTAKNKCLWGGVSGALTIEQGSEAETEAAVLEALSVLGKGGGFILSPVDNVRENTPNAWKNTYKLISTWKKHRQDFL